MSARLDLVVTGGTLVSSGGQLAGDLGVRNGRVVELAPPATLSGRGEVELDARDLLVMPGVIDPHVHFRQPGFEHEEDWESGTTAAVHGGVTTVLDMPNTRPPTATVDAARHKHSLAAAGAVCDFGLFGLLADDAAAAEELAASGLAVGLKAFLGPTTGGLNGPSDDTLRGVLMATRRRRLRLVFHAEDAGLVERATTRLRGAGRRDPLAHLEARPAQAEAVAIERVGRALVETRGYGHIAHVSSVEGLAAVEHWRAAGAHLTCEVTPHHALLGRDAYQRFSGLAKVNPPIRGEPHASALLAALADGRIDMWASDHAPHLAAQKTGDDIWEVAAGIPGVETLLALLLTKVAAGRLTLESLVRATSEAPARAFGLWPRKGSLALDADADMVLVRPVRSRRIRAARLHSRNPLTPFEGRSTIGTPVATVVRGRVVMREGELLGEPGWGAPVSRAR